MKIKRQICLSNSRDVISPHRLLRVTDGGLECTSIEEAKEKFGIVQIGTIPTITSENTIDLNVVPSEVIYPTIIGPSTIEKGRSYKYTIRNFDSVSTTYNVSVDEGSVSRVEDVITITAPEESTKEYLTLTINGYSYSLIYYVEGSVSKVVVSGREYYRHSSGMGTVMKWVDKAGATHNTLVLDAAYRNALPWDTEEREIPGLTNYSIAGYSLVDGTMTVPSKDNTMYAATAYEFSPGSITDATINAYSRYFEDVGTSKANTTTIVNTIGQSNTYAAGWCRAQTVNGVGCDLPNAQTLTRIYCSIFTLDDLDASASNNKFKFTMAKSGNDANIRFGSTLHIWSSTQSTNFTHAYFVDTTAMFGSGATITKINQALGVVPVLEL